VWDVAGKVNRTRSRTIEHKGTGSEITHILVLPDPTRVSRSADVVTVRVSSAQLHLGDCRRPIRLPYNVAFFQQHSETGLADFRPSVFMLSAATIS
jgi:hypothetical protein